MSALARRSIVTAAALRSLVGFLRRGESNALAIEIDIAFVVLEDAGDRLDQRRLARTVVAGKAHI